jgi:prepilin signal peptidase PulO-like enzyme (type II secretory pathway)
MSMVEWSLPVAVIMTGVAFLLVIVSPLIIWKRSRTWSKLSNCLPELRAYSVPVANIARNDIVSTGSVLDHRHLGSAVILVGSVHPSAVKALRQLQRDVLTQFLYYIFVLTIVFVIISAQYSSGHVSIITAVSGIFLGGDLLLLIRLSERYRLLTDQIEDHGMTLDWIGNLEPVSSE